VFLGSTPARRHEANHGLFKHGMRSDELKRIRACTRSGAPMGSEPLKAQIEKAVQRLVGAEGLGRPAKTPSANSDYSRQ
jgi:hypothetical protein